MTVRNVLQDFFAKPLSKLHNTVLMAGWTKVPALTRKCEQEFVTAVFTFDPGKAIM